MAEREVTLKIGTKTSGDAGKAMQDVAKHAKEAAKAVNENGKAMADYIKQTRAAAAADREFAKNKEAIAAALDRERAAAGKTKALNAARQTSVVGGGGGAVGGAVDKFNGAVANATSGLLGIAGAASVAMKALSAIGSGMKGAYRTGKFEWDDFGTGAMDDLSSIPGIGWVFGTSKQSQARDERERRLRDIQQIGQRDAALGQARGAFDERALQLGAQFARFQAVQGMGGLGLRDEGGIAGPSRQVAMAQAEAAFTAQFSQAAQARAALAFRGVDRAQGDLGNARSYDEKQRARERLANAQADAERAVLAVQKAQEANLAAQQKRQEAMLQLAQAKVDKLRQEKQAQDSIVEAEKQRMQTAAEQWGGMSGKDQLRAKQVGQTLAARGIEGLTQEQLEFARSIQLFSRTIQEQQRSRGEGDPAFQELVRLLGEDKRLAQAQAASVEIQNKLDIEIKLNEQTLAQQMQQQVTPRIQEMMAAAAAQLKIEVERIFMQQRAQRP